MARFSVGDKAVATDTRPPTPVKIIQVSTWKDVLSATQSERPAYLVEYMTLGGVQQMWLSETVLLPVPAEESDK